MKLSSFTKYLLSGVINRGLLPAVAMPMLLMLLFLSPVSGQEGQPRPSSVAAQAAWQNGDYELAYGQYNSLLLLYSRDPLYQFYTGACLVVLKRDIQRAVTLLATAINSSAAVRSVPDEVWFYYGRALHLSGSYGEARDAYGRYARLAGRRALPGVREYIEQCNAGEGALATARTPANVAADPAAPLPEADRGRPAVALPEADRQAGQERQPVPLPGADRRQDDRDRSPAVRQAEAVHGDVAGIPDEQFTRLREAAVKQHEADSMARLAERLAGRAGQADQEMRGQLEKRAADEAARAVAREAEADQLLTGAGEKNGRVDDPAEYPESDGPGEEIISLFAVIQGTAYSTANPVPVDPPLPGGLIYTIQIAAFRNDVAPSLFKGLTPVFARRRQGSDALFYYSGLFRRSADARNALPEAKNSGFPDAFVIALMDGNQVSAERASLLEKEWRSTPLGDEAATLIIPGRERSSAAGQPADQLLPVGTLSFRAEAMRVTATPKPDVIERMEALAGSRGLEMIKNSKGETVFLIGNFITFESAEEYVSLLIRNGYSSARVTAWVGTQEIPVSAARELINKLPDD